MSEEYITEKEAAREVEKSREALCRFYADELKLSNESRPIEKIIANIEEGLKDGTIVDNWDPVIDWGAWETSEMRCTRRIFEAI